MLIQKTRSGLKWIEKLFTNCVPFKKPRSSNVNSTKITDVNIVCLESIFTHLSLPDLLNVADSNTYLKKAAAIVFVQKYGKEMIQLNGLQASKSRKISNRTKMFIGDLKTGLQILRCFGHLISRLEISDEYSNKYHVRVYVYIFEYIYKFCKSLVSIKFQMLPRNKAFKYLRRPFKNVETVEIFCCNLEKNQTPLNVLFPKMQSLKIDFCKVTDLRCVEQHFVHLEYLLLSTTKENIQAVLKLNPQLKQFATKTMCDMQLLQCISELQSLKSLDIVCSSDDFANFNGPVLEFKNVKKIKLDFSHTKRVFPPIPLVFNQLEEFSTNHRLNAEFYDFIAKHPHIRKLSLPSSSSKEESVKEKQLNFLKTMHSLKEINLCPYFRLIKPFGYLMGLKR